MSKINQSMPAQLRKKMKKELRAATNQPEPILKSKDITPKDLLSRLPPKSRKTESSLLKSFEKRFNEKKKKQKQKPHVSKRTTPGSVVGQQSSPHIVHIEGKRWIKTIQKQNTTKRKILTKHLGKKRSK